MSGFDSISSSSAVSFARCALLMLAMVSLSAASEPAPATITTTEGKSFEKAFVVSESMDGIAWVIDDPRSTAKFEKKAGQYSVEYKQSRNTSLLKGDNASGKDPEGAIVSYTQALAECKYDWEREHAYVGIARAAEVSKKYDDGIQAIQGLEKEFPKSLRLPEATYLKGRLLVLKGDKDGALKVMQGLRGHDKDWGVGAGALGVLGIGELLSADTKFKEAATELAGWFPAKINPATNPDEFARIGLALAQYELKSGGEANAIVDFRTVAFSPCSPDQQARAHLGWARLLADQAVPASQLSAFDHAAIAASLKGQNDPSTRTEAVRLATGLVAKIKEQGANDNAKNALQIEYKTYLSRF